MPTYLQNPYKTSFDGDISILLFVCSFFSIYVYVIITTKIINFVYILGLQYVSNVSKVEISKLFSDAGNILEYAGQQGFVTESLGHLVLVHPQRYLGQPGSSFAEIGHQTSGLQHLYHPCKRRVTSRSRYNPRSYLRRRTPAQPPSDVSSISWRRSLTTCPV